MKRIVTSAAIVALALAGCSSEPAEPTLEEQFLAAARAAHPRESAMLPDADMVKLASLVCRDARSGKLSGGDDVYRFTIAQVGELGMKPENVLDTITAIKGSWETLCPDWFKG